METKSMEEVMDIIMNGPGVIARQASFMMCDNKTTMAEAAKYRQIFENTRKDIIKIIEEHGYTFDEMFEYVKNKGKNNG